ncbi:MAG: uroporphyrinogen-III synthase [Bacteroidetes bacterium]|nr:MAG: uroporphyrinogen-III synthase [Bacteroidota bacterium]PTM11646.1 MAG: uroporphyrinogen-III synthase [Bacteroidota bacterium]
MVANVKVMEEKYKRVKSILVSQPKPERSPYYDLEKKYNLQIDWRPFIHVEGLEAKEFRKQRVRPDEFTAVIFTAKNAVDHFFRVCEDMRIAMSQDTKYFCMTEAIANYLQKFIVYRKRKVFFGKRNIQDLAVALKKNKDEKFLLPCSNLGAKDVSAYLTEMKLNWQDAMMYKTVSSDLSDLSDVTYDILVFFSPLGITSLYENFPDFKQKDTRLAIFGNSTLKAVEEHGLQVNIQVEPPEVPSMTRALEIYLEQSNPDQV